MELASMLAGEPFSDRPKSVCPVIGAFLRPYNDRIDGDQRQDLYGPAARIVGTRGDRSLERHRARLCRDRLRELTGRRGFRLAAFITRSGRELVADLCAKELAERGRHAEALELIDALIAAGGTATASLEEEARQLHGRRIPH